LAQGVALNSLHRHEQGQARAANSPSFDAAVAVLSPLDAWWRIQDLLWRLNAFRAVDVLPAQEVHAVRLLPTCIGDAFEEIQALMDPDTDGWFDGDVVRHLIACREPSPEGTTFHFATAACIAGWPDGSTLVDEMNAFFYQLSTTTHDHPNS
jgi:hypothetical protein